MFERQATAIRGGHFAGDVETDAWPARLRRESRLPDPLFEIRRHSGAGIGNCQHGRPVLAPDPESQDTAGRHGFEGVDGKAYDDLPQIASASHHLDRRPGSLQLQHDPLMRRRGREQRHGGLGHIPETDASGRPPVVPALFEDPPDRGAHSSELLSNGPQTALLHLAIAGPYRLGLERVRQQLRVDGDGVQGVSEFVRRANRHCAQRLIAAGEFEDVIPTAHASPKRNSHYSDRGHNQRFLCSFPCAWQRAGSLPVLSVAHLLLRFRHRPKEPVRHGDRST